MKKWEHQLKNVLQKHDNVFGHNIELSKGQITSFLRKIEKLSLHGKLNTPLCEIFIIDNYTIEIILPEENSKQREDILMYILTSSAPPTNCIFNKRNDSLTLEWVY